ncbi:hypothetical protein QBC41DRAFT_148794 [Cercophora samala]|uniref:Uncharacterized protein n=1 Tax=Cercophora samala TaxID=330535 RepID=A0AA39ZA53_9PEZI|nr:hypothetical protein QBC41DRAFT_148794 [Cercophora samala]
MDWEESSGGTGPQACSRVESRAKHSKVLLISKSTAFGCGAPPSLCLFVFFCYPVLGGSRVRAGSKGRDHLHLRPKLEQKPFLLSNPPLDRFASDSQTGHKEQHQTPLHAMTDTDSHFHMGAGEYKREAGCSACPRHHEVLIKTDLPMQSPLSATIAILHPLFSPLVPVSTIFSDILHAWSCLTALAYVWLCVRSKHYCCPLFCSPRKEVVSTFSLFLLDPTH